jgi:hypothetical protein
LINQLIRIQTPIEKVHRRHYDITKQTLELVGFQTNQSSREDGNPL